MSAAETRACALEAAHRILLEEGPDAVSLKSVARRVGCTHANLLHHFGSVEQLNREIGHDLAGRFSRKIEEAVHALWAGKATLRQAVDQIFDALARTGGADLIAWMKITGNPESHEPIVESLGGLIDGYARDRESRQELFDLVLSVIYLALGDALMGERLTASQGQPRDRARVLAARLIRRWPLPVHGSEQDAAE